MSGVASAVAQSAGGALGNPVLSFVQQELNKFAPIEKPNIYQAIDLFFKGRYPYRELQFIFRTWGYNEKYMNDIIAGAQQQLDIQSLITLFRRGQLGKNTEENYLNYIKRAQYLGVGKDIAEKLLTAGEQIASPQQLITFMVREVFNEEISTKFGQFLEFPDDLPENKTKILPEFEKLGISEQLARWLWAAHWTLPDFGRAALALFRYRKEDRKYWEEEVIQAGLDPNDVEMSYETVSTLLKTQDVMPYWRPKMLATTFQDLGQIQLRWAIRFGFVDYDKAVYLHKRQGLPQVWAELITKIVKVVQSMTDWKTGLTNGAISFADIETELAQWHISEASVIKILKGKLLGNELSSITKYRELSLAKVVKAFKQGQIDRNKTIELIQKLKYDENTAKFILEVETFEDDKTITTKQRDLTKSDILSAFRVDTLTQANAQNNLQKIGYDEDEAKALINIEVAKKIGKSDKSKTKERDLTKTDYLRSLQLGLRTAQETFEGLLLLNYSESEAIELIEQKLTAIAKSREKKDNA